MTEQEDQERRLPAIALRKMVLFPGIITALAVGRPRSVAALREARSREGRLVLLTQRDAGVEEPSADDLFASGVVCRVAGDLETGSEGVHNVLVEALQRCRVSEYVQHSPYIAVRVEVIEATSKEVPPELRLRVRDLFTASAGSAVLAQIEAAEETISLDSAVAFALELPVEDKVELLAEPDPVQRYRMLIPILETERDISVAGERIRRESEQATSEQERRRYLEERRQEIEDKLAELSGEEQGLDELRRSLKEASLPPEARREADRELSRLSRMPPGAQEFSVAVDFLNWLSELPWDRSTEAGVSLQKAREILDRDHYDRQEVKERILEYLSVRKLRPESEGGLLCFVGAPGVGKTSLGRSIADATDRKFQRISLGGIRDEAEVRGHRRTYVGALPGRIIRALRDVGVNNPVLMLDEMDKVRSGLRGDPTSALLEVLDPEQNHAFVDNYLGVPFDLSRIMFIGTANTTDTIPPSLLDRLEVIELSGYSTDEKMAIARRHLLPKQLEATGLEEETVRIEDPALELLIEGYTREAGVRGLERQLATVLRKMVREHAGGRPCCDRVTRERLAEMLGPRKYLPERDRRAGRPGICATLAVAPEGGRLLLVEVDRVRGSGKLLVTGRVGEILGESARLAYSYWKSAAARFGFAPDTFERSDFHVHFPVGGVAKEGTSAGLAIALAFASQLAGQPLPRGTAVLGEVSLHGRILRVDRLEERLAAARRAEIERVLLPGRNRSDVEGARRSDPAEGLEMLYVSTVAEAVGALLPRAAPRPAGSR